MLDSLTQQMKDDGVKIIQALDQTQDKPTTMMWSFLRGEWVLMMATMTSRVEKSSDRDPVGARIAEVITEIVPNYEIKFALTGPASQYFRNLAMLVGTGPDEITGMQLSSNLVNGQDTGNNYVYRLHIQ